MLAGGGRARRADRERPPHLAAGRSSKRCWPTCTCAGSARSTREARRRVMIASHIFLPIALAAVFIARGIGTV
jgi:hypothetical protein